MRWKPKPVPEEPIIGDVRRTTTFIWWPINLQDGAVVWLERIVLVQRYGRVENVMGSVAYTWITTGYEEIPEDQNSKESQ